MRSIVILGLIVAAPLGLGACGSEPAEVTAASTATASPSDSVSVSPESNPVAQLGETVRFDVGLAVTAKSGGLVKASEFAAGAVNGKIAVIKIILKNEGAEPIEAHFRDYFAG